MNRAIVHFMAAIVFATTASAYAADDPGAKPSRLATLFDQHDGLIKQLRPLLNGPDPLSAIDTEEKLVGVENELIAQVKQQSPVDQPMLANLRDVVLIRLDWLADAYGRQGHWDSAIERRTAAARLTEEVYGGDHWQTHRAQRAIVDARSLSLLSPEKRKQLEAANDLERQAKAEKTPQQAAALWQQVATVRSSVLGEQDVTFAAAEEQLAMCQSLLQDFAKCEESSRLATQAYRAAWGENDPQYAWLLNTWGLMISIRGDASKALPLLTESYGILERRHGENDPRTRAAAVNLASASLALGQFAAARSLLDSVVALERENDQTNQATLAVHLDLLGSALMSLQDYGKAEQVFAEAAGVLHKLGEPYPQYSAALGQLSLARRALGDGTKALAAAEQAAAYIKQKRGERSLEFAAALTEVAKCQSLAGLSDAAFATLRNVQAVLESLHADDTPQYADLLQQIGALEADRGHIRDSKAAFDRALNILKNKLGENHLRTELLMDVYATRLMSFEDYAAAADLEEKVLALRRRSVGEHHSRYADALLTLASCYSYLPNPQRAEPLLRQALEICKQQSGEKSIPFAYALEKFGHYYSTVHQSAEAIRQFSAAAAIYESQLGRSSEPYIRCQGLIGLVHEGNRGPASAEPFLRTAADLQKHRTGDKSPEYAERIIRLGVCLKTEGKFADAEALIQTGLTILQASRGADTPDALDAQTELGGLRLALGQARSARDLLADAADKRRRIGGPQQPELARTLIDLAGVYLTLGEANSSIKSAEEAVAIYASRNNDFDPYYARALGKLGAASNAAGDYFRAESLLKKAAAVQATLAGEYRNDYAATMQDLGFLHFALGDFEQAKSDFVEAARVARQLGEKNVFYLHMQVAVALAAAAQGDFPGAAALLEKTAPDLKAVLGEQHISYAAYRMFIGYVKQKLKDYSGSRGELESALKTFAASGNAQYPFRSGALRALGSLDEASGRPASETDRLYREAKEIVERAVGKEHPAYADSLIDLAALQFSEKAFSAATNDYLEALNTRRKFLDRTFLALSERQQLVLTHHVRGNLDMCLSLAGELSDRDAYNLVLQWKAASFRSQQAVHEAASDPATAELVRGLHSTAAAIVELALVGCSSVADRKADLQRLAARHEELEEQLARSSAAYAANRRRAGAVAEDVCKSLPPGSVLLDFIEYQHAAPGATIADDWQRESCLIAFVAAANRDVVRVELGAAEQIYQPLRRWRRTYDPAQLQELRRLLLLPLAKYLKGATLLLVSPDGELARLPWAALPTDNPNRVLLDDLAVAVVPAAAAIPEMLQARTPDNEVAPTDSLLLVGDINYNAVLKPTELQAGSATTSAMAPLRLSPAVPRGGLPHFPPLSNSDEELTLIAKNWPNANRGKSVVKLTGEEATSDRFCRAAPASVYIHVATHGYFAPAELRSALGRFKPDATLPALLDRSNPLGLDVVGHHPGILSGLAMAGANEFGRPRADDRNGRSPAQRPDRILSALEIAGLDLPKARLVVLSACETGLGENISGEGSFSLQRAFHVAGAETVVSSLWPVPDRATSLLMAKFYDNLWRAKMSRVEALRSAQRWLRQQAASSPELFRGLTFASTKQPEKNKPVDLPPQAWAGFVLSGDWR